LSLIVASTTVAGALLHFSLVFYINRVRWPSETLSAISHINADSFPVLISP